MPNCRAVLLKGDWCELKVVKGADQLDRSVLQSVMVDEVTLIKVSVTADLLRIVLVKHPDVLRQVALVV